MGELILLPILDPETKSHWERCRQEAEATVFITRLNLGLAITLPETLDEGA